MQEPLGPTSGPTMGAPGKDPGGVSARASFRIPRNSDGNSDREAASPFPVQGSLLCVPLSLQESALEQRVLTVWSLNPQHHLGTTSNWPRPRAAEQTWGGSTSSHIWTGPPGDAGMCYDLECLRVHTIHFLVSNEGEPSQPGP